MRRSYFILVPLLFILMGVLVALLLMEPRDYSPTEIPPSILFSLENIFEDKEPVRLYVNEDYYFGKTTLAEFAEFIVKDATTDDEKVATLYNFFLRARHHHCSWGSSIQDIRLEEEHMLTRIFSFAFGCCNDVNTGLAALYEGLGFDTQIILSPKHTIAEVTTTEGKSYLFDVDLPPNYSPYDERGLSEGSFDELYANNFVEAKFDYSNLFNEELGFNRSLGQSAARIDRDTIDMLFDFELNPGERAEFYKDTVSERIVAYPALNPEDSTIIGVVDSANGRIYHDTNAVRQGSADTCTVYEFESPFVIAEASIEAINPRHIESLALSFDAAEWTPLEITPQDLDGTHGRYYYFLKVCSEKEGDFSYEEDLELVSTFQWNRLLLPGGYSVY